MVDWDLAVSVGSRLAGAGPEVSRAEADAVVAELRDGRRPVDRAGPRLHRAGRRSRGAPRRSWSSTGRAGSRPTPTASTCCVARWSTSSPRRRARPTGHQQGRRVAGDRRRGRRPARLPGRQGARPVRPVPRPGRPAAAGGPQHRPRRARARRRPARLPALGLPARGDPPRAVHRRAVDARPPVRRDRARSPRPSSRPSCSTTASSGSPRRSRAAADRSGSLLDVLGTPEQREILDGSPA